MRKSVLFLTAALILPAGAATAQTPGDPVRGIPVQNRPRPDFDPAGLRAGTFLVYPQISLSGRYDDNIFADESGTVDDVIYIASPQVRLQSDWNRHALNLRAAAEIGRYADNGSEDYEDYVAALDGRLDILRGTTATGRASFARLHEDRGSPDEAGGLEPTEYDLWTASATLDRSLARLGARLTADYRGFDFNDVPAPGGAVIDQDDRDRDEYGVAARLSYATSPNLAGFIQAAYNWRRYEREVGRDSEGYRLTGGVALDFGGVTSGEIFAGYRSQDYDNPAFPTADGLTYGASLAWNPTTLTSLAFTASNTVEETTSDAASAYVATLFRIDIDHELLRNLLIGGYAGYLENDYERIDRTDDVISLGASLRYLVNRNFQIEGGYDYTNRDSNLSGIDYDRNIVYLRLTGLL
ncbi:outer membrane beta-barrel protein [Rhodospirillum centenum]|uniref:Outer membrane beta-barrel protein n=1 Tax=Rhodospirillum centenum (strain ATCC 51521 / SW) TaxID=414684 RepID=B6IXV1_RHOCS|nr:outer membrane beta-barrel protein [Rhodospirillum centenum]ACJ01125.1 conserved hypothetical protein [Rhodospirillum centenum SW]